MDEFHMETINPVYGMKVMEGLSFHMNQPQERFERD